MFKRIALISNRNSKKVAATLHILTHYLQSNNINFVLDNSCANMLKDPSLTTFNADQLPSDCDLAVAIGGDGTMIRASHLVCDWGIPLLGINHGRLGFLADIPADTTVSHLELIFQGDFVTDERFLLQVEILRNDSMIPVGNAINDIVLQKWNIARLIEFETYVNNTFVHRQRSDGLIISSPTGSTAYSLSGGGPILHPDLNALALVPICPHTLTNRPIVINGDSRVDIVVSNRQIDKARLTCDGEIRAKLEPGDRICICKSDKYIKLIHPADYDHYNILREKLQWGTDFC